ATLAQYIINLLKSGNSADNVNHELQQYTDLTDWIFARANELENPAPPPEQKQQSPIKESNTTETTNKPRGNRIFAHAIGSINGSTQNIRRSRSRSRSPEVRPRGRDRERSPYRKNIEDRLHDPNGRHQQQRSINGRQVQILDSNGTQKQNSRPSVFDRLGGTTRPVSSTTQQPVERCKYWPSCSQGEKCIYFHPKTICPDFPNCSKPTNECMFIHPEVSPTQQQQQPMMMSMPIKRPIPCKFFPYCTNPMCPFVHPEQPVTVTATEPSTVASTGPIKRVPIPCKMGDQCKRPGCHFIHPGDDDKTPASETLCKYDGSCTRPGCFYKHTVPPQPFTGGHRSLVLNKKENPSDRQFSVADESEVERIVLGESADLIKKEENKESSNNNNEQKTTTVVSESNPQQGREDEAMEM
ncbi:hypothetical protein INT45_011051, partial [Circinella minor]